MIMILGASGYIGGYLFNRLKMDSFDVVGTYSKNKKPGLVYFDMGYMDLEDLKLDLDKITHIIILASANAKPDAIKENWEESYFLNVERTKKIIDCCFKNCIIPIYFSSDAVFDGEKGSYKEEDETNPINSYGKIKYEVEKHIFGSEKPYVVLRMGKVFGLKMDDNTILTNLLKNLKQSQDLILATDQIFTPLYIGDLMEAIKKIIQEKYLGIFHLASLKATDRYEIASKIKSFFHLKHTNITSCKIDSLNLPDSRPKLIDLDIGKWKKLIGFKEKPIEHYLKKLMN